MAWSEMSYNRDYSRNKEIMKEDGIIVCELGTDVKFELPVAGLEIIKEKDYFDAFLFEREDEFKIVENYGLFEDFSISNCYGVEDVYNDVDNWN